MLKKDELSEIKISRFEDSRKVFILPRPYGSNKEVIEHAIACCKYAESACRIPVLDPEIYPQVFDYLRETGELLSVCQAANTPLEECDDVWVFCQSPSEKIRKAKVMLAASTKILCKNVICVIFTEIKNVICAIIAINKNAIYEVH